MKRIDDIDQTALEVVRLLHDRDKSFISWVIGRASEILETGEKVETLTEYRLLRKRLINSALDD